MDLVAFVTGIGGITRLGISGSRYVGSRFLASKTSVALADEVATSGGDDILAMAWRRIAESRAKNGWQTRSQEIVAEVGTGEWWLLGSNRAVIDPRKFTEYALNPSHPVGGNKAKVFETALGYNQSNYQGLIDQIREGIMKYTPQIGKVDAYGSRYSIDILVEGPAGSAFVRTGWIFRPGANVPELTTAFIR